MNPKNMKKNPSSYMSSLEIIKAFSPSLSRSFFSSLLLSTIMLFFSSLLSLYLSSFPTQDSNLIVLKSKNQARLLIKIRIKSNYNHNNKIEEKLKQIGKRLLMLVSIMLLVKSPDVQLKSLELLLFIFCNILLLYNVLYNYICEIISQLVICD